jgi:hypothetical protein
MRALRVAAQDFISRTRYASACAATDRQTDGRDLTLGAREWTAARNERGTR